LLALFRMPLAFYRVGLGSLLVMQMLLATVGRKTGRSHRVVVDILEHDKTKDIYYVSAAFGLRSDWYLNISANPTVHAQVGRRKFTAQATTLPLKEAEDIYVRFVSHRPHYVRIMMRVIGVRIGLSEDEIRSLASYMPVVAIKPMAT